MKRILIATDGSASANRALDYAVARAKEIGAQVLIVNVMGQAFPEEVFQRFTHAQQSWVEELFTSLSSRTLTQAQERARLAGAANVELESRSGDVAQSIIDAAREKSADAIVIGKRGAGHGGLLLGSVSHKLVSLATCPVTVVP